MSGSRTAVLAHRAERVEVSDAVSTYLPGADYSDAFRVEAIPGMTARDWAHTTLAAGPDLPRQAFGTLVWHGVLGFELAKADSPGTMVGWSVTVDEPRLFVLTADGRMAGVMIFRIADGQATWTTAVRHQHPSSRRIWAAAQHVHRALAARLLARAGESLRRHQ